jgi:hypothetical protein
MYGHGQIEGFHEKYGMEFRKPKWDETPDEGLIGGHEWKIFPILHRRYLFADVEQFFLYDMHHTDGGVDENVFAYSNVHNDERGLVLYHNRFAETRGWIKISAAYLDKHTGDMRQKTLAEGLSLPFEGYVIFQDYVTHLEYIRSCEELWQKGMYFELRAYQHHVFMDWRFVENSNWGLVHSALNGAGVESMQAKWDEMFGVREAESNKMKAGKVKKPRRKAATKKKAEGEIIGKPTAEKKAPARRTVTRRKTSEPATNPPKKTTTKKPKTTDTE